MANTRQPCLLRQSTRMHLLKTGIPPCPCGWFRAPKGVEAVPESKIGQEMLPFAHIRFDNVELDESWRLQGPAKGFPQLFSFFEYGRVFACATALGEAQAAMDDAVEWARERTAFGTPVSNFQQVKRC